MPDDNAIEDDEYDEEDDAPLPDVHWYDDWAWYRVVLGGVATLALVVIAYCAFVVQQQAREQTKQQKAQTSYARAIACWQRSQAYTSAVATGGAGSTFGPSPQARSLMTVALGSCGLGTAEDVSPPFTVPTTTVP
jgi:hypothetical protein